MADVEQPAPLHGLRVLDLGRGVAAPFCARILARFGADVIKLEPPGGDPVRLLGARARRARAGEGGALHLYVNEGKRGVVLDADTPSGRDLLLRLVAASDIVVETSPAGENEDARSRYAQLQEANPRVVLTSISGYGEDGPYKDFASTELSLFAMGGHMYRSGVLDRPPVRMAGFPAHILGGIGAAYATLLAQRVQGEQGIGQHVTFSIFESQVTSHAQAMVEISYYGEETAAAAPRGAAGIRGLMTRDGLAMLSAQEQQMPRLAQLVGAPEELGQANPMDRGQKRRELMEHVAAWAAERTKRDVYHAGQQMSVPASYAADPADLLESPQYRARGFIQEIDDPDAGTVSIPGLPFQWEGSEVPIRPAPRLGEHTSEVLQELLGLTRAQLGQLAGCGVTA